MTRQCAITGKAVQTGHNVSHANNKTLRRFLTNLQSKKLFSEILRCSVRLRLSTNAIRSIEKAGGINAYLLNASDCKLSTDAKRLKKRMEKAAA